MLAHELTSAQYVVNNAALTSCFSSFNGSGLGSASQSYTVQTYTSTHCCVCAGACWHTTAPSFCPTHDPNQPQITPSYTPLPVTIGQAIGVGTPINTNGWVITGNGSSSSNYIIQKEACYICKDELSDKEVAENDKVCRACRTAVETFKQVLVEEAPAEKPKRRRKK